jgi:hypothetical protein
MLALTWNQQVASPFKLTEGKRMPCDNSVGRTWTQRVPPPKGENYGLRKVFCPHLP